MDPGRLLHAGNEPDAVAADEGVNQGQTAVAGDGNGVRHTLTDQAFDYNFAAGQFHGLSPAEENSTQRRRGAEKNISYVFLRVSAPLR